MVGLLISSISLYAIFALELFEKDKSAYIYGNSSEANISFNHRLESYFDSSFERLNILSYLPKNKVKDVLTGYRDVFHLDIISPSGSKNSYYNLARIEDTGLSVEEYKRMIQSHSRSNPKGFKIIEDENTKVLFLEYKNSENGVTLLMYLNTAEVREISNSFSQYESYILNLDGSFFWGDERRSYFDEVLKSKLEQATIEVDDKAPKILSFKISSKYELIFITEILRSEAYKVNDYLVGKSKVFGLVLLSLSIFIALLFSRSLTSSLEKLYNLTLLISKGEFHQKAEINSKDEIGALGDSINFMSAEILKYMEEMKEKARLENEIETAKYVQSTYFPPEEVSLTNFSISSFYKPASECGGDWWGYVEDEERLTVLITDATGHGVPAALLTATAHCCLENLKQNGKDILSSPAKILEFMNTSIQCLDGKMLMTAFCCTFDKKKKTVTFANASHNPPLYKSKEIDSSQKNNFKPLLGDVGPRLGHKEKGHYVDEELCIDSIDRVLFFTDGILESKNNDGKEYGQRRFLKSLNSNLNKENTIFRKNITSEAFSFFGECQIDDDITLVSVFVGKSEVESESLEELKKTISEDSDALLVDSPINDVRAFYVSNESDEKNISILKRFPKLNHIVGQNSSNLSEEIVRNNKNLKNRLTLEKYLEDYRLHNTAVKSKVDFSKVNTLLETLDVDGYFESPIDYLKIITNELLTNAMYHSGKGETFDKRSSMDRSETPKLLDSESIDCCIAVGERHIAICVVDFTGKLTRDLVISNLERSFRERGHQEKRGGAGLGLFLAFSYSNQFVVRTFPGKKTEVICIIEKNKRFKTYKERVTSFHYFEVEEEV